ncbi:MAG TPA: hypothetical protein VJL29_11025 [Thermoguttaceae bacterium]|nr:hypothetical protein [Thermoguttaceae bacterium]
MSHSFPPELQRLLHEGLASGHYRTEDEMLLEALQLLRRRDGDLERFKRELQTRLTRLERGEGIELEDDEALRALFDDVQARGTQRYEASRTAE